MKHERGLWSWGGGWKAMVAGEKANMLTADRCQTH